ncbi:MAG: rhomboid family intramembrane serine protease [Puniceicoccales bacterium]|jgi:membrane associated rhomboid family serine protease|nr:rhomboid family intramembrane serine protease [Puniceicoccales bacterium]
MRKTFRVGGGRSWSALGVLLWTMAFLFIIDKVSAVWFGNDFLRRYLLLSVGDLGEGKLWQLLTYLFVHDDFWHIFCNGLVLFFVGRLIEQKYGKGRLLEIFFVSGFLGALAWFFLHSKQPYVALLGASAGCSGVFSYFCLTCENRSIIFLLFFIIPVRLKPRLFLALWAIFEIYCLFVQELGGRFIANSAHLGGMLGGCMGYFFYKYRQNYMRIVKEKLTRIPQTMHSMRSDNYKLYITSHLAKRREVDRILDKINEHGFKSLSEGEKNTLNAAKHIMHR